MRNPWEDDEEPIGPDPRDPDMGWDDREPDQGDIPESYFEDESDIYLDDTDHTVFDASA